jgi:hypothetical protein
MDSQEYLPDRRVEDILYSNLDAVSKLRKIVDLGYEEEAASEMVEYYQLGQRAPVYYERLNFDSDQVF